MKAAQQSRFLFPPNTFHLKSKSNSLVQSRSIPTTISFKVNFPFRFLVFCLVFLPVPLFFGHTKNNEKHDIVLS